MRLLHALLLVCLVATAVPTQAVQNQKQKPRKQAKQEQAEAQLVPGLRATLVAEPREVEVGEPIRLTLEIHHPKELVPILPGDDLGLGPQWIVLEDYGAIAEASPDGIEEVGFWITRKSWQVLALREFTVLPSLEIFFGEGAGALSVMTSEGELEVKSLLSGANAGPRPRRGFRDPSGPAVEGSPPWWVLAPGVTLVLIVGWWLFARRRGGPAEAPKVEPLAQLDSMSRELPDDLQALQALHYSLTALVREATEERLGRSHAGTTDEEWLELVRGDARVGSEVEEQLDQVFKSAQSVKYARIRPSSYAVEETLKAARAVLESLNGSPGGSA